MKIFAILLGYNVLFFRDFYANPFKMCTSELASTFFPFSRWLGRQLRHGKFPFKDEIYYKYPACIPFLSLSYLPYLLSSWASSYIRRDSGFRVFAYFILVHYLLASVLAFYALLKFGTFIALFGAISLTYSAYFVKLFTPCAVYTHAWVLGALGGGKFGAFCLGMAILGGYWPTLVYILPVIMLKLGVMLSIISITIGLPQIIPFLWYWPKSIRYKKKYDPKIGKVPLWRYLDLLFPNRTQNTITGVFWPEMALFMGIVPIVALVKPLSVWLIPLMLSFVIRIQRIPARSLYLFSISLIMASIYALESLGGTIYPLLILQGYLLLQNAHIYPHFPFCQWWKKPSELDYSDTSKWPGFTGYMTNTGIPGGYKGGFALRG